MHLQRNNLYVSQNIEQQNLTVNQVLVPIFFQKQVIKTFLRQELFISTFRLSKQMSEGTRSSTLFLYPCYYGDNLQKLFLKYFFYLKNPEEISMIWYTKKNYKSSQGILLQFQVFSWILLTFHFSLFISPLIPIPPMS